MKLKPLKKAKALLECPEAYIVDLETTGLLESDPDTRIVQITLMDMKGRVVFSSFINPGRDIPREVSEIHGIYGEDVSSSPALGEVFPIIRGYLTNSILLAYNAGFDCHLLTHRLRELGFGDIKLKEVHCLMEMYQVWLGESRSQPLPNLSGGKKHDSIVDCTNSYLLLKRMAGQVQKQEIDLDF